MKKLLGTFLLTQAILGCNHVEVSKESPFVNKIAANSEFVIKLPENHTEGHNWQLQQDFDQSVVQQVNEVWHGNEKGIYFHLRTRASGETTLNFTKRKYSDTLDYKSFTIKISGP